jgi:hypothetical protein
MQEFAYWIGPCCTNSPVLLLHCIFGHGPSSRLYLFTCCALTLHGWPVLLLQCIHGPLRMRTPFPMLQKLPCCADHPSQSGPCLMTAGPSHQALEGIMVRRYMVGICFVEMWYASATSLWVSLLCLFCSYDFCRRVVLDLKYDTEYTVCKVHGITWGTKSCECPIFRNAFLACLYCTTSR